MEKLPLAQSGTVPVLPTFKASLDCVSGLYGGCELFSYSKIDKYTGDAVEVRIP